MGQRCRSLGEAAINLKPNTYLYSATTRATREHYDFIQLYRGHSFLGLSVQHKRMRHILVVILVLTSPSCWPNESRLTHLIAEDLLGDLRMIMGYTIERCFLSFLFGQIAQYTVHNISIRFILYLARTSLSAMLDSTSQPSTWQ